MEIKNPIRKWRKRQAKNAGPGMNWVDTGPGKGLSGQKGAYNSAARWATHPL